MNNNMLSDYKSNQLNWTKWFIIFTSSDYIKIPLFFYNNNVFTQIYSIYCDLSWLANLFHHVKARLTVSLWVVVAWCSTDLKMLTLNSSICRILEKTFSSLVPGKIQYRWCNKWWCRSLCMKVSRSKNWENNSGWCTQASAVIVAHLNSSLCLWPSTFH